MLTALALLVWSNSCFAGNEVTWALTNAPPACFEKDGRPAGILPELVGELEAAMPGYGHKQAVMPREEVPAAIKRGEHVCSPGMAKSAGKFAFSLPCSLVPPPVVAAKAGDGRFQADGPLSLGRLAAEGLRLGVAGDVGEWPVLHAIVFTMGRDRVVFFQDRDAAEEALVLLDEGSVDFVLLGLFEGVWAAGKLGMAGEVAFHALREEGSWLPAYVACPDTDWGREAVAKVNEALRAKLGPDSFAAYEPYLPSEAFKKKAGRKYKSLILDKLGR